MTKVLLKREPCGYYSTMMTKNNHVYIKGSCFCASSHHKTQKCFGKSQTNDFVLPTETSDQKTLLYLILQRNKAFCFNLEDLLHLFKSLKQSQVWPAI